MKLFYEKYIKLAHIGKGANAHVYQVRHAELDYVRAIKILNDYIEKKSDRAYQSFLKECKTLLAIGNGSHPNIVRIYGPDLIDNRAIVEMDYIQGVTLDSYVKEKGFLEYDEVKTFIHDIVGALAYTHHDIYKFLMNPEEDDLQADPNDGKKFLISSEKEAELVKKYGIAHNDLHSNNVMRRDYDGRFVLLDFGLAIQDGCCIKSSHIGDGNPEYMAPEKFDSEVVSPRSDVYSLGILIYELITGHVPFELEYTSAGVSIQSRNRVLNQHLSSPVPDMLSLRKEAFHRIYPDREYHRDYPEWLDKIVLKCLEKNPADRYEDARALLDDINQHISRQSPDSRVRKLEEKLEQLQTLSLTKSFETSTDATDEARIKNLSKEDRKKVDNKNKGWKIALIICICALIGVGIWGYCMFLDFQNRDARLDWFEYEARERGIYSDSIGWEVTPEQMKDYLSKKSAKTESIKNDTMAITNTVIEYRTPPEVQRELSTLRNENSRLKGQVERLMQAVSN